MIAEETDELKTFLKIRPDETCSFFEVSKDKKNFLLKDGLSQPTNFNFDGIFMNEENSYFYEEICRNIINEVIELKPSKKKASDNIIIAEPKTNKKKNFCIMSYGNSSNSTLTSTFGAPDSIQNINNRGLLFRFIEALLNNLPVSKEAYFTFNVVYLNKYLDFNSPELLVKPMQDLTDEELLGKMKDIKDLGTIKLEKKMIKSVNDIIDYVNNSISVYSNFKGKSQKNMILHSHIMFAVQICDKNIPSNVISKVMFCVFPSSERSNLIGTEGRFLNNHFNSLVEVLGFLKGKNFLGQTHLIPFSNSALTIVLKDFLINCKLRIIGYISPHSGQAEKLPPTLVFLTQCKNTLESELGAIIEEKVDIKGHEHTSDEEVIKILEKKLKSFHSQILKEQNEYKIIKDKMEAIEKFNSESYKIISEHIGFQGDITRLLKSEYSAEKKYAQALKDTYYNERNFRKLNAEKEEMIKQLKDENKFMKKEKNIILNDIEMVKEYKKQVNLVDDSKEKDKLKKAENDIKKQYNNEIQAQRDEIDFLKGELAKQAKMYLELPGVMNANFEKLNKFDKERNTKKF